MTKFQNQRHFRKQHWRAPLEFYETPAEAVLALLTVERFSGSIWEPACGNGAISKALEGQGAHVVSSDIVMRKYPCLELDFLKTERPLAKNIITNPPYGRHGLADAFISRSIQHVRETGGRVAMLLNLRSLAHPDRTIRFLRCRPSAIYVIDELVCWPEGKPASFKSSIAKQQYAWVIWEDKPSSTTKLDWLSPRKFRNGSR